MSYYLRQRPERGNVWYVSWYKDRKQTSWRTSGETDRTKAEEWAKANEPTVESERTRAETRATGRKPPAPEPVSKNVSFKDFAHEWFQPKHEWVRRQQMRGRVLAPTYLDQCRGTLKNHVLPRWADCKLKDITTPQLDDWLFALRERYASETVNHVLSVTRLMLAYAARKGIIKGSPATECERMVGGGRTRGILTMPEAKEIFDERNLDALWEGSIQLYAINLLGASCGMRLGEIRALQRQHLKLDNAIPHVEIRHSWHNKYGLGNTKTKGSNRDVPLPALTAKYLQMVLDESPFTEPDDLVFTGDAAHFRHGTEHPEGKTPIGAKWIDRSFRRAMMMLDIACKTRWITFHSHRHYYVSIMRGKLPEHLLRALTGHTTALMTEHYTHTALGDVAQAAQIQDAILSAQ
jgi:integrase